MSPKNQAFEEKEKMLNLKECLLDIELNRIAGRQTHSLDELEEYLADIIEMS